MAALLDDDDLVETACEFVPLDRIDWEQCGHLLDPDAGPDESHVVEAEQLERLAQVVVGLPGGDEADAGRTSPSSTTGLRPLDRM